MIQKNKHSRRRRTGFTLIEVLLVIGILVVLGTVSVVVYSRVREGANKDMAGIMVNDTAQAVEMFYAHMNRYPGEDGLKELLEKPSDEKEAKKWRGPYIERIPVDPWGGELKYEKIEVTDDQTTAKPYHIWSTGPDKEDGTDDDIKSWTDEESSGG